MSGCGSFRPAGVGWALDGPVTLSSRIGAKPREKDPTVRYIIVDVGAVNI